MAAVAAAASPFLLSALGFQQTVCQSRHPPQPSNDPAANPQVSGNDTSTPTPQVYGPQVVNLSVSREVAVTKRAGTFGPDFAFAFGTTANPSTFHGAEACTAVAVPPGQCEFSQGSPPGTGFTAAN